MRAIPRKANWSRGISFRSPTGTWLAGLGQAPFCQWSQRQRAGKLFAVSVAAILALSGCSRNSTPADESSKAPPAQAAIGKWGFDIDGMDRSVDPGNDFYDYANGQWRKTNEIPADLSRWGAFIKLARDTEGQVHDILESVPADGAAGSIEQKVHDYYRAYLDVDAIEQAGMAPAKQGLSKIEAAKTHADIARLMGTPGFVTPINVSVTIDEKNPDRYILGVTQSGLSLPDRDYYLKDDKALAEIREKFQAHVQRTLELAEEPKGKQQADAIFKLETQFAERHWPVEKRRERELTYNLLSRKELEALAPKYPWAEMLNAGGLENEKEFVVSELDAVQALGKHFATVPVSTWRSYLKYHYLVTYSSVLPQSLDEEVFDFYGRTLNGQPEQRDRWRRAVSALNRSLGEAVGQLYVKQHFPPDSKQKMVDLVENLRRAYEKRMHSLPWMSEETKQVALEKLGTFRPKIGYPDKWKDYAKLEVHAGDAFGNTLRAQAFDWQTDLERLGKPTDKDEWFMSPQTVNAYYNPTFNEVVFPAAILQPPFFDPNADPAINYGAIGGVIGHEMGHGFDDQGAKSDAKGVLRTWWKPNDETEFKKLVDGLVAQYGDYEVLPGLNINGRLTVGENIGDLGGLSIAHEAYLMSLDGKEAPVLDGFTGEQRFFLGWAQVWRDLMRDKALRNQVMSDPHSPALYRVQGVVRNMDSWYKAFDVTAEDKLFLAPQDRVSIW